MERVSLSFVKESYRGRHVRVFALNREAAIRSLAERARRLLADDSDVVEVRLFGSIARGDAGPGSDADVIVLLRKSTLPFLERSAVYARRFSEVGIGCDVFAYTVDELEEMRRQGRRLVEAADREGIALASR